MIVNVLRHSQRASFKAQGCVHVRRFVARRHVSDSTRTDRPKEIAREIYASPASRSRQILAYVGAVTQILFWGNLAQWAATAYTVKDKETDKYEIAPTTTRYVYAGWLAGMGAAFGYAFLFLPSRIATRATFLPKSKTMLIESPHIFLPWSKVRVMSAPISKLSLSSPLYTGKGPYGASPLPGQLRYMALNVKGKRPGYAIDREGQFAGSAKAFDALFRP